MVFVDIFLEIFGKVPEPALKYEVLKSTDKYEVRKTAPFLASQVTYDRSKVKDKDAYGFFIIAEYNGEAGNTPKNTRSERITMTSPVLTSGVGEGEVIRTRVLFPPRYKTAEEPPRPLDERVEIKEEGEGKFGVVRFGGAVGSVKDKVVEMKAQELKRLLEEDGYRVIGEHVFARSNPP